MPRKPEKRKKREQKLRIARKLKRTKQDQKNRTYKQEHDGKKIGEKQLRGTG